MDRYDVSIQDKIGTMNFPSRWTFTCQAESFAHAEEQAKDVISDSEEIINISKDWE